MYKPNQYCASPTDPNVKIWRYMDFTKLLALFENSSLFFSKVTLLPDQWEACLTNATVENYRHIPTDLSPQKAEERKAIVNHNLSSMKQLRELLNVSCWHMNNYESAAMWRLYLKSEEGVAIQSTFQRLCDSFMQSRPSVHVGVVNYIDFEKDIVPIDPIAWGYHKRKSFEHERELRACVYDLPAQEYGIDVAIDLRMLIEQIYIAPSSPDWILNLIQKITHRYGLKVNVSRSDLERDPIY